MFEPFPLCPTEIRLKIWYFSLPEPREIGPTVNYCSQSYICKTQDPAALQVNQESREVALKHYTQRPLGRLRRWRDGIQPNSRWIQRYPRYVDYTTDTILALNIDHHLIQN